MTVTARIPVGAYPHGLRLSPDGRLLAVANMKGNTLSLVDTLGRKPIGDIEVGRAPVQVALTKRPPRRRFAEWGEQDRCRRRGRAQASVEGGGRPRSRTGHGHTRRQNGACCQSRLSDQPRQSPVVGFPCRAQDDGHRPGWQGAHAVALDAAGRTAYVTNTYADTVSAIDLASRAVTASYSTGKGPNGISVR